MQIRHFLAGAFSKIWSYHVTQVEICHFHIQNIILYEALGKSPNFVVLLYLSVNYKEDNLKRSE